VIQQKEEAAMTRTMELKRHNKAVAFMDMLNLMEGARQLGVKRIDFNALRAYFEQRIDLIRAYAYIPRLKCYRRLISWWSQEPEWR